MMQTIKGSNPIVKGHYADPEARYYEGKYWIYVTHSTAFPEQKNLTVFSSDDMVNWECHENIIQMEDFPWVWGAVWAPTIIEKNGKYYLIFATNDIHSDEDPGGLEIAVSDSPAGPFRGYLGHPLIGDIYNNAQPIDAHLFEDTDGTIYLYYGGWGHCIVAVMNETMDGFLPLPNGEMRMEITPEDYVEGPCMIKREGKYFFLWSSGKWNKGDYHVNYGVSDTPFGPFVKEKVILETDESIANSPGHNSYIYLPEMDEYYMVYHRRPMHDKTRDGRELCIDRLYVQADGIKPVEMT